MTECQFLRRPDDGTCLLAERWCGSGGACPTSQEQADAWYRQATGLWHMQGDHEFPWPGRSVVREEEPEPDQDDLFGDAPLPSATKFVAMHGLVSSMPVVDDLVGVELDYWVARAIDAQFIEIVGGHTCFADHKAAERAAAGAPFAGGDSQLASIFQPSTDWSRGGYVIARHKIGVAPHEGEWYADMAMLNREDGSAAAYAYGPTPLIAAMRCMVRSVYGRQAPEIYPSCELAHRPDPAVKYWRDDPEKRQAWLENEHAIWGEEFKARDIEFAHVMALLDDELRGAPNDA